MLRCVGLKLLHVSVTCISDAWEAVQYVGLIQHSYVL